MCVTVWCSFDDSLPLSCRSYQIQDVGHCLAGVTTLMYLVDAGFDFDKLQDKVRAANTRARDTDE